MKNIDILQKVADLVGFKFGTYNFAEVELEGGLVITNQTEGDFMTGDVVSLKNDDGTFTIVGAGEHTLLDGSMYITDAEGKLVEIREKTEEVEAGSTIKEDMEEVSIEIPSGTEITPDLIEEVVKAMIPMVQELKTITEDMKKLKKDFESFKASSAYEPLNEDKTIASAFSTDHRYAVLRDMKEKMRR